MDAPGGPRSLAGDVEDLPTDVEMHPRWVGFGWRFVEKFVEWIWSSETRDRIWHDWKWWLPSLAPKSSPPFTRKWKDHLPTFHFSGAMSIFRSVVVGFGKWDDVDDCLERSAVDERNPTVGIRRSSPFLQTGSNINGFGFIFSTLVL